MVTALTILLLIIVLTACWLSGALGMPGKLVDGRGRGDLRFLGSRQTRPHRWAGKTVVALAVLAGMGEILELLAGAAGNRPIGRHAARCRHGPGWFRGRLDPGSACRAACSGDRIPPGSSVVLPPWEQPWGAIVGEIQAGQSFAQGWHIAKGAFWGTIGGNPGEAPHRGRHDRRRHCRVADLTPKFPGECRLLCQRGIIRILVRSCAFASIAYLLHRSQLATFSRAFFNRECVSQASGYRGETLT